MEDLSSAPSEEVRRVLTYQPSFEAPPNGTSQLSLLQSSSSIGTLVSNVYRYIKLQESEFRLVELLPATIDQIQCRVHHASLRKPPQYVAVSYAWGDITDTTGLQLDGIDIAVAVSVYGALRALRDHKKSTMVWIDALCIDQQNKAERTHQVGLMTDIYSNADSVAVWLGPEADGCNLATEVLRQVADKANSPKKLKSFFEEELSKHDLGTVVSLFEREYWKRLWIVQEIHHARNIMFYCGSSVLPEHVYWEAARAFIKHKPQLKRFFEPNMREKNHSHISPTHFSPTQVLTHQGPASILIIPPVIEVGHSALLEVMQACRRKLCADPRDKVFGILGVLPQEIRKVIPVDYSLSVKKVYTNVVVYLLDTTKSLDVICESIHFPLHADSNNLPSWVPDWSHIPGPTPISLVGRFCAGSERKARYQLVEKRNKLEISAIKVGSIRAHGVSVGTLCTLADYLMAFLHWRALLLQDVGGVENEDSLLAQERFCRTLCLDQVPGERGKTQEWLTACYHVFASLLQERLPKLQLDRQLRSYASAGVGLKVGIKPDGRRRFVDEHFGSRMMGRCFCITNNGSLGIGSGFMTPNDVIVVPLGCSTPIILRQEGARGEYRFVGDVYLHGYMHMEAVEMWEKSAAELQRYVLH